MHGDQMTIEDLLGKGPTVVTTVRMSRTLSDQGEEDYEKARAQDKYVNRDNFEHLDNRAMAERIAVGVTETDVDQLIKDAMSTSVKHFANTGEYRVCQFTYPVYLSSGTYTKPISIRLPKALDDELKTVAKRLGTRKSSLIRSFIGKMELQPILTSVQVGKPRGSGRKKKPES